MSEFGAISPEKLIIGSPDIVPEPPKALAEIEIEQEQLDDQGEPVEDTPPPKRSLKFVDHDIELPETLDDATIARLEAIGKELEAGTTKRFQQAAEERKAAQALQARAQAEAQVMQQHFAEVAALKNIDSQLDAYSRVDWQAYTDQDPVAAQKHFMTYTALQNQRQQTAARLQAAQAEFAQNQQQTIAEVLEKGSQALKSQIADWGEAKQQALAQHSQKAYGFKPDELANVMDPRVVLMMHDAYLYRQSVEKAKAKPSTPAPEPVTKVGSVAPASKTPDKMSTAEWMEWRNKQVARKNRR